MIGSITAFVPIRSFDGMTRLSDHLLPDERRRLSRRIAERVVDAADAAGLAVTIVTGDDDVRQWATNVKKVGLLTEPDPAGLNAAAEAAVAAALDNPWLVIHADLPAIEANDLMAAAELLDNGTVLSPSHDGGTSLIGGIGGPFPFRYGPGSFQRHFAAVQGRAAVLVRSGLALDLDQPSDLAALLELGHLGATAGA